MMAYADKLARLAADIRAAGTRGVGLAKTTSNLFRDRASRPPPRIALAHFDEVIAVDPDASHVEAEGMTTYAALVDATLAKGTMPAVVPQLKSITLGGAVAGVGIEATSFRQGLVHDTVLALDVLTGDGRVVTCTPDNEHRDLFYGFPNSYGTLGYALKVTARTIPVKRFVRIEHTRHDTADACFAAVARVLAGTDADFVDGVVFAPGEIYLTVGRFVDDAPACSDYTFENIYYRSIRERRVDFLTTRDFLWRWDADWFWCSKNVGAQHPLVRRLLGPARLNSLFYQRVMRWNSRWGLSRAWYRLRGLHPESVIQDVDIPLERATEFLAFVIAETGILPLWICPIRPPERGREFPLYPLRPAVPYVNFGFWDVVADRTPHAPGFHNRRIERMVERLGGLKSLYSDSYFTEAEFAASYGGTAYAELKARYDPGNALGDRYRKCVLSTHDAQ
jgi:FAD/FMN-containing dehydrogenase